MESNAASLVPVIFSEPNNQKKYTVLLPQDVQERVSNYPVLAQSLYESLMNTHPINANELTKELTVSQSMEILRRLGRQSDKDKPSKSVSHSGPLDSSMGSEGGEDAHDLEPHDVSMGEVEEDNLEEDAKDRVIWRHPAILLLLDLWRRNQRLFSNSCMTQKQAWRKISEMVQEKEYTYSAEDCAKKFRSLRDRYKMKKKDMGKTGRGQKPWKYYSLMDELFQNDPSVNPPRIVSSLPLVTQATSGGEAQLAQETEELPIPSSAAPSPSPAPTISAASTSSRDRKRKKPSTQEPEWFIKYREEEENRHRERMEIERKKIALEERRVKAIEKLIDSL